MSNAPVDSNWESARGVLNYVPGLPSNPRSLTMEQRRDVGNALRDHGWSWPQVRAALQCSRQEGFITKWSRKAEMTQVVETLIFLFVIVILLAAVGVICKDAYATVLKLQGFPVQLVASKLLGDALLIVIVAEIVETVRQQLRTVERIHYQLIHNFLVIGIVAAVRHLLYIGAVLSLGQLNESAEPTGLVLAGVPRGDLVLELGVNCAVVFALVICWVLVDRQVEARKVSSSQGSWVADRHLVLAHSGSSHTASFVNVPNSADPSSFDGRPISGGR